MIQRHNQVRWVMLFMHFLLQGSNSLNFWPRSILLPEVLGTLGAWMFAPRVPLRSWTTTSSGPSSCSRKWSAVPETRIKWSSLTPTWASSATTSTSSFATTCSQKTSRTSRLWSRRSEPRASQCKHVILREFYEKLKSQQPKEPFFLSWSYGERSKLKLILVAQCPLISLVPLIQYNHSI